MSGDRNKKKKNGKKRGGNKKISEQLCASKSVHEWAFLEHQVPRESSAANDFGIFRNCYRSSADSVVFELHCHSNWSDGFLSPTKLVERAHAAGVKVLALTDHDTMSGIPEALEAACRLGVKIIPGVEISTIYSPREGSESEEPVHILAYYSSCGPKRVEELENLLANIRDGRFLRAKNMVSKLNRLKVPIKWEHVVRIAGAGVAPGRVHVARAMVESGHVESLEQAFARYLYDGGPAYARGNEPLVEEAIKLICDTGGMAALAHPWSLKNPIPIIRRLKDSGLHGIEVYRSDGKVAAYSALADAYGLVKIGGSDYHGTKEKGGSDLGSANLPVLAAHRFLKVARPIWCNAIGEILMSYVEEPSDKKLEQITMFGKTGGQIFGEGPARDHIVVRCLSLWLTEEERKNALFDSIKSKLSDMISIARRV